MSQGFTIRLASPADVEAIAGHRAGMFEEMGQVPPDMFETGPSTSTASSCTLRKAGLSLYDRLGFVGTNEMRLTGD